MIVTPQLALRVAILGGIALVLFAMIFFRLWYLQVLSGDKYLAEANDNRVREVKVEAPRGRIVDRNGSAAGRQPHGARRRRCCPSGCRTSRRERGRAVPPPGPRARQVSPARSRRKIRRDVKELPFSPVTLKTDVGLDDGALPRRRTSPLPGGRGGAGVPAQVPARRDRRAPVRDDRRGDREAAEAVPLLRRRARRPRRAIGHRVPVRPLPAWAQRRQPRAGRRARAARRASCRCATRSPASGCACRSTSTCRRPARPRSSATGCPAGSSRSTRAAARCWGSAATRASTPTCSRRACAHRSTSGSRTPTTARRSPTARPRACTRPAPRSSW